MTKPTIFVVAATGTQGGAVARLAIKHQWAVHATARDPDSIAARSLASVGVRITRGDWDDETALQEGITGCNMLFLNLFPDFVDQTHERRQAQRIIRIARDAGVKHVVYSGAFPPVKTPSITQHQLDLFQNHWITKMAKDKSKLMDDVKEAGFDHWTILRPGFFMANFVLPKAAFFGDIHQTGVWSQGLLPSTQVPLIDHEDIAKFTVAALDNPERYGGQTICLAGELLTPDEIVRLISETSGKNVRAKYLSDEEFEEAVAKTPPSVMQLFMRDMSQCVDMEELKDWGIPLGGFKAFLSREKGSVDETYAAL